MNKYPKQFAIKLLQYQFLTFLVSVISIFAFGAGIVLHNQILVIAAIVITILYPFVYGILVWHSAKKYNITVRDLIQ